MAAALLQFFGAARHPCFEVSGTDVFERLHVYKTFFPLPYNALFHVVRIITLAHKFESAVVMQIFARGYEDAAIAAEVSPGTVYYQIMG